MSRNDSEGYEVCGRDTIYRHRQPLTYVAICYCLGTLAGLKLSVLCPEILLCSLAMLFFLWLLCRSGWVGSAKRIARWCGWSIVFLLAWLSAQERGPQHQSINRIADGTQVEAIGTVVSDPEHQGGKRGRAGSRFKFRATDVKERDADWVVIDQEVDVCLYGLSDRTPQYGDRLRVKGNSSTGRNGWAIGCSVKAARLLAGQGGCWVYRWSYRIRHWCERQLSRGLGRHREEYLILTGLLLGRRAQVSGEAREAFRATGTLHVFAISGLHSPIMK